MILIKKELTGESENIIAVDPEVISYPQLSNGAKVLYIHLCGIPAGHLINHNRIAKVMGISKRTLILKKKELKDMDLILIKQVAVGVTILFVGNSNISASTLKNNWEKKEYE